MGAELLRNSCKSRCCLLATSGHNGSNYFNFFLLL